jgi:hypothetical protein
MREYTPEDEGQVEKPASRAQIGEVGHPQLIRAGGGEVAIDQVTGPGGNRLVADGRRVAATANDAGHTLFSHQACHVVTTHLDAAPIKLTPGALRAVDGPKALACGADITEQPTVVDLAGRGMTLPVFSGVVGTHRHRQLGAYRLDPEGLRK